MPERSIAGRETELFHYMREKGYPIYHRSNIFRKDFEYGIRDFYRVEEGKDIGTRESIRLANDMIQHLESSGKLTMLQDNTWILDMPEYLNKPDVAKEPATEK